ncbi:MAG TPA: lipopolysaccharide biosynthesis protein [Candidatus Solibacter sp.]|nr:lipopolysaccharide biosynthesis protein [Candidatus Solibacter sp.]
MNSAELTELAELAAKRRVPAPAALPELTNFAWAVTGNVVFALCQWGIIVALAKAGSTALVGRFSLGIAIATPILMFSNCDLRAVQATDAKDEFHFIEYLRLRRITTTIALAAIFAIAILGGYGAQTGLVIAAVGIAKAVETFSDVHYGLFQLNGRLDQTGRSMILRGVLAVTAMTIVLLSTGDVLRGSLVIAMVWTAVLCMFDVPRARRIVKSAGPPRSTAHRLWTLARTALPLGLVTTAASVNLQIPRYFVHARLGERGLGVFSALAYTTVAMTLVGDSLGQCIAPRLSRLFAGGRYADFASQIRWLVLIGCMASGCGVAIAYLFGGQLLRLFYSPEYAANAHVFSLLTAGAAIQFIASILTTAITASRNFAAQVPMYLAMLACTALGCARWIPAWGIEGAAFAVIGGAVVRLTVAAGVVWRLCGGVS